MWGEAPLAPWPSHLPGLSSRPATQLALKMSWTPRLQEAHASGPFPPRPTTCASRLHPLFPVQQVCWPQEFLSFPLPAALLT